MVVGTDLSMYHLMISAAGNITGSHNSMHGIENFTDDDLEKELDEILFGHKSSEAPMLANTLTTIFEQRATPVQVAPVMTNALEPAVTDPSHPQALAAQ
jgi:hypothetical protein